MSWLFFSIATALLWGTAELFYKKGAVPNEKYSHLKICVWVGIVMGAHAIFTLLTQDINYNPINLIRYLPVSLLYIISMAFSYFGMRFLEESISDPFRCDLQLAVCHFPRGFHFLLLHYRYCHYRSGRFRCWLPGKQGRDTKKEEPGQKTGHCGVLYALCLCLVGRIRFLRRYLLPG